MRRYCNGFLLCFMLAALLQFLSAEHQAETVSLTILHTNDTHSHLLPFSYPAQVGKTTPEVMKTRNNIGGVARRSTLIKRLRAELEPKGTTVWVMDAGDFSDGTPFSIEYQGDADAAAMNAVGYTLGTLGNHEFNYTRSQLEKLLGSFKFPILAANVADAKTGKSLTEEYKVLKMGPVRIGVFGLVAYSTRGYPAAREGIRFAGEITTARRMMQTLARQADIVILLSHCGVTKDEEIAEKVPGIAAIVGGHSHSRLPFGRVVGSAQSVQGGRAKTGAGTILVQAYQWGGELGRLDLTLAKDASGAWSVVQHKATLIPVTSDIPEDPEVAKVVEKYWEPIADKYEKVVGKATADFVDRGGDQPSYNLMADALREMTGTDIALENIGGVRAPLLKGNITLEDLAALDPFDNTVIKFRIRGERLRGVLRTWQPAVSGIKYRVEKKELIGVTIGGKPLQDDKYYTGVTNSYYAPIILRGIKTEDTGRQRRDVLIEYIREKKTVSPAYDLRRVVR